MMVPAIACGQFAFAHQAVFSDGSATDADNAIELTDPQISRVVYHEVTAEATQLWLTFEIKQPQILRIQLGVPLLERLEDYRPAMALLGPGLPLERPPFEMPEGLGVMVFDTADVSRPQLFAEPFTGTSSWILIEQDVDLPSAGRYYIVAYAPTGEPGKLWVATGTEEVFDNFGDFGEVIAQAQAFHEVPPVIGVPCFYIPVGLTIMFVVARDLLMRR